MIKCDKMLDTQQIRILCDGSGCISGTDINYRYKSKYEILPEASDKLHRAMLKAIGEYSASLTKIQEELETGKAKV